jgi:hypothetical protein
MPRNLIGCFESELPVRRIVAKVLVSALPALSAFREEDDETCLAVI